jgi:hypothetical protein
LVQVSLYSRRITEPPAYGDDPALPNGNFPEAKSVVTAPILCFS